MNKEFIMGFLQVYGSISNQATLKTAFSCYEETSNQTGNADYSCENKDFIIGLLPGVQFDVKLKTEFRCYAELNQSQRSYLVAMKKPITEVAQ